MSNTRHILVTGGAGYIGSHTVVELIQQNYIPVIVDDFRNSEKRMLAGIESTTGVKPIVHEVDINNKEQFEAIFKKYSFGGIIHFAADKAVGESVAKPLKYYANNVVGLINCVEMAHKYKVPNFVFSSSCTVYGEPKGQKVVSEETETQEANSPYGATKQFCERILSDVNKSGSDLKILCLRYFNPVGAHESSNIGELPLDRPNNLLPYITQTAIGKLEKLTVYGNDYNTSDGTCIRDYIHVMDLANAHLKGYEWLETKSEGLNEIVNVGTGEGVSVLEVIETFEKVSGEKLNWQYGDRREGDVEQIYADASKANSLLGWKAKRSIDQALIDAWNWEKNLKSEN